MTDRAAAFLELHQPGAGFVLPNAWDAGSARMLEQVGFPAIATTSAGIAFSRGVPDAGVDGSDMLDCIAQIVEAVNCPVTADLESGYGATADQVADTITAAVGIGVVGANLEDGSFVLNARTDTYMAAHPDAFAETIRRAEQYVAAGADCIFVPGVSDADEIGRLTAEIDAPVNVVAGLVEPVLDAATLRELGVARISVGGTLTRAALSLVDRAGREMLEHGTFSFADGAISYGDFQQRLRRE